MTKLPGWGAAASAAVVALACAALPVAWLESIVDASGVAALVPVAAPPLGMTARAVLALGGGALVATIMWSALYILFGDDGFLVPKPRKSGAPVVRRADAHPDAPPRRPLTAAELTAAPAPVPVPARSSIFPEADFALSGPPARALPLDLDTPLSAVDPAAMPSASPEPIRALAPGERMETFALTPPTPPPAPVEAASIEALLQRLEHRAGRRAAAG